MSLVIKLTYAAIAPLSPFLLGHLSATFPKRGSRWRTPILVSTLIATWLGTSAMAPSAHAGNQTTQSQQLLRLSGPFPTRVHQDCTTAISNQILFMTIVLVREPPSLF